MVYGDIEESLDELSDEQVAKLFRGMVNYFNTGNDPKFSGVLKMAFIPIRQQMDRDMDKYERKCQKNKENIQSYWDKVKSDKDSDDTNVYERIPSNTNVYECIPANTIATNTNTKTNTNTDTKTETETMSAETDGSSLPSFLIQYLNEKAGTNYNVTPAVERLVNGLLDAGYSPDQMRTVIDRKCDEWLSDEKMRSYLRPSTLFGSKFEEYLSAPVPLTTERKQDEAKKKKLLEKELAEKRQSLDVLRSSLAEIPGGTRMDERRLLKEQIAQLEDSIGLIEGRLP